jgi:hypothetical protein
MPDSRLAGMRSLSSRPARPLIVAAVLMLGACGDDATVEENAGEAPADSATSDLEHIHGLGVHPRNGTLYIATHFGLFSAASGETKLQPVGDSRQDIMGFSVVSAERFIGSGHPEPDDSELPPNLGLIESTDGGKSWQPVSLLGEADFHVLRSRGATAYGFNGLTGKLMTSRNGGHDWDEHDPPGPMLDLAIDPSDPEHIVASVEEGLVESRDAGRGWRPLADGRVGLLAWNQPGRLYFVDAAGLVSSSADGGRSWREMGSVDAQPAAFAASGGELYAALPDGTVKRSSDDGATWSVRATP